jgi:hypothetical protein
MLAMALMALRFVAAQETTAAQTTAASRSAARRSNLPPQVVQAERFLAQRGWRRSPASGATNSERQSWEGAGRLSRRAATGAAGSQLQAHSQAQVHSQAQGQGGATWQPLGPTAVLSQSFGLVTGRISSLALDPSDLYGNTLYVGTTGGGVWKSQNAATSSSTIVSFIPLTDDLEVTVNGKQEALSDVEDASISIGAVSVRPDGTGEVILAGTGDPNDARDSYYGAGILRSADGGTTWSLISSTSVTSYPVYYFDGEGFAGFAWSTVNTDLVVAAVSQAYDATLVNAVWHGASYEGLYYSTDGGATWSLATITDGSSGDVQGPEDVFVSPDGNAATSVVWNPVRNLFIAAVRYHGYYQSSDGKTFTRLPDQPGTSASTSGTIPSLSSSWCPTNAGGSTGSPGCPIFRGTLAVNPLTGDTFAWTVDEYNQDQGIWQDKCSAANNACVSPTMWTTAQAQQWGTAALETNDPDQGVATIENGDYNLTLAAVPSGQETMLLAGANDLWQTNCPYSQGCRWRNTTNSTTCMSAKVGEYQHALAWNASNPLEIFVGNDSGLWRSVDGVSESSLATPEPVCSSTDASHFQNLNGSLGSLADVTSISQAGATPYTMMAGLGTNGTAGVASTTGPTTDWPEILGGEGGPVAIDPVTTTNWYINNAAGVSINLGAPPSGSTPGTFNAVLDYTTDPSSLTTTGADVVRDGLSMAVEPPYAPAIFLVDPLDSTKLLIGTCRLWRGPANGVGWIAANAIDSALDGGILDGITGDNDCSVNALIRSMAALALPVSSSLPTGGEVVYVGMYGAENGGATRPGHVLRTTYNSATTSWSAWTDVTALNAVTNDTHTMNYYGLDISSIFIDPLVATGETVYVTVAGVPTPLKEVQTVYGSTDGGAHWTALTANLPSAPANSLVVDPASSSTVYVATDAGVYATQAIGSCATSVTAGCWAPLGSGLPDAPAVQLSAAPVSASVHNLIAATYGRGIWTTPLLGVGGTGTGPATDTLSTTSLTFPDTNVGQLSPISQNDSVTLTNSGSRALTSIAVSVTGAFTETNPCTANLAANSSCTISVRFAPTATGYQTGTLTIYDIKQTQTVDLSGIGIAAPALAVSPASLSFNTTAGGASASQTQTLTVTNTGGAPLANVGFQITGLSASSFSWSNSTCGATLSNVSDQNSCTVAVTFTSTAAGGATASLAVSSSTPGVAAVAVPLTGTGQTLAGLGVSPAQLVFPIVAPGKTSATQTVIVTNNGTVAATSLTFTLTLPFSRLTVANPCGTSLAVGASCSVGVVFTPTLDGSFIGTLTIASSSLASSAVVLLSGTGAVPGSVLFHPNPLTFAEIGVGATSGASTVTITNPDSVTSLQDLTIVASTGFLKIPGTCGTTLAAGASCTVGVEFTPTSAGTQSGTLTVSSSGLTTGSTLALSGTGFDFALCFGNSVTLCVTSSTRTIANGQTADYTLTIAPLDGTQGSFALQCHSLPAYSSCTFNPTSPTPYSGASVYETVEIATGLAQTSTNSSRPPIWPALPLVCGLALVPFGLARWHRALLLVALLAILGGGVSSCTSSQIIKGSDSGGHSSGSGITPAGTYSIPVTVTSNGISRQIILTLTVD